MPPSNRFKTFLIAILSPFTTTTRTTSRGSLKAKPIFSAPVCDLLFLFLPEAVCDRSFIHSLTHFALINTADPLKQLALTSGTSGRPKLLPSTGMHGKIFLKKGVAVVYKVRSFLSLLSFSSLLLHNTQTVSRSGDALQDQGLQGDPKDVQDHV